MKMIKGKLPLSTMAIVICAVAFSGLIFAEDLRSITASSFLKLKSCSSKTSAMSKKNLSSGKKEMTDLLSPADEDLIDEDRPPLDSYQECSIEKGEWVFNSSAQLPYTDESCPFLDMQVACRRNGRPDDSYLYWEWQPDDCMLPQLNAAALLEKLRGKRLMFSGDSLQRGQWQSLVCMVESHIQPGKKAMKRGRSLSVFMIEDYNATIEFYWAPYLIQSNSDQPIIPDTKKRILRVNSISKHARHWVGADYLIFNSYVWYTSDPKMKSQQGSFANKEEGYEEIDALVAYRMALKTWANWIDSNVNRSKTKVFFTTASPTHFRSRDWKHESSGTSQCLNETGPASGRGYWGSGSDRRMMAVVSSIVGKMKFPVTFINITHLSDYRKDGHASIYTRGLADRQKAGPPTSGDCIHWCLPGVPDTWNKILFAYL